MGIQKAQKQDKEENKNIDESNPSDVTDDYRPGKQKDQLYVENEEDKGKQVVSYLELKPGPSAGRNTAFVRLAFSWVGTAFDENPGNQNAPRRKHNGGKGED